MSDMSGGCRNPSSQALSSAGVQKMEIEKLIKHAETGHTAAGTSSVTAANHFACVPPASSMGMVAEFRSKPIREVQKKPVLWNRVRNKRVWEAKKMVVMMVVHFLHTHLFPQSAAVPLPGRTHSWHASDEWKADRGIRNDVTQQRRVTVEVGRSSNSQRQQADSEDTRCCEGQEVGPAQGEGGDACCPCRAGADRAQLRGRSRTKVAASGMTTTWQ